MQPPPAREHGSVHRRPRRYFRAVAVAALWSRLDQEQGFAGAPHILGATSCAMRRGAHHAATALAALAALAALESATGVDLPGVWDSYPTASFDLRDLTKTASTSIAYRITDGMVPRPHAAHAAHTPTKQCHGAGSACVHCCLLIR